MDPTITARLRDLPSVSAVLNTSAAALLLEHYGQKASTNAIRATIEVARAALQKGEPAVPSAECLALESRARLEGEDRSSSRPLFNLTGTVLHTNLGRAVLAEAAVEAAVAAMQNPVALEFDLETGKRGERDDHIRGRLCDLTGAEDATVVNNNAAAVLLVLNALAEGREVIVSRGELIEIGGAFRIPDIMARAGCRLVEVGTTNRTHLKDYAAAIGPDTAAIMKVHPSNFAIAGFTKSVAAAELVPLAREKGLPLIEDLGSGTLVDLETWGLPHEPTAREAIDAGIDIVTFSGDKLLGGPQAGLIVGRRPLVERIARNPMKRALRLDKVRLAALEATLRLYADPARLAERLPTIRALARPAAEIRTLAERVLPALAAALGHGAEIAIEPVRGQIGSGALPVDLLPSFALAIRAKGLERLADAFRGLPIPVIGRIGAGKLYFDLRTLDDEAAFVAQLNKLGAA